MLRLEQLRKLNSQAWAIDPQALHTWAYTPALAMSVSLEIETPPDERLEANGVPEESAALKGVPRVSGAIQVMRMYGGIEQHSHDIWGIGTSTEEFGKRFDAAMNDPAIAAVVVDIQSPGGTVFGTPELSDKIYAARGTKPTVALANSYAASAAYWAGSAFDKLFVTPSGKVGSVGVFSLHEDYSKALEEVGIKFTFVSAGKFKVEGNPFEPLSDDAKQDMQRSVDAYYDSFVKSVARNRGAKVSHVEANYGQGRLLNSRDALAAGMVDGVGTMQELLGAMGVIPKQRSGRADGYGYPDVLSRQRALKERGVA